MLIIILICDRNMPISLFWLFRVDLLLQIIWEQCPVWDELQLLKVHLHRGTICALDKSCFFLPKTHFSILCKWTFRAISFVKSLIYETHFINWRAEKKKILIFPCFKIGEQTLYGSFCGCINWMSLSFTKQRVLLFSM